MTLKNIVFGGVKVFVVGLWCVHGTSMLYYAKNLELYKKDNYPQFPCDILEIDQRARDRS